MDYTIVGGGIAAYSALKAIRNYDPHGRVTVLSEEKHCFYYRPMTSLVIKGDRERDELLREGEPPEHSLVHDRAVGLDAARREVRTASGGRIAFDRLLIATGSAPVRPTIEGLTEGDVHFLRTLDDAHALLEASRGCKRAVVIGGGLVGIKKAVALSGRGLLVTVIEQLDHILLPRLDREGAEIMAARLEERGISLRTGVQVKRILAPGRGVELADGSRIPAELVCVAVGVRPNIDWLMESGIALERAIVVDERMRTNVAGVFAAGDVVQAPDLATGRPVVSGLWTNAVDMGRVAGTNMAGVKLAYPGSLEVLNATEIEGLAMISVGNILAEGDNLTVVSRRRNDSYRKLVFKDDVLVGAVMLGDIERAGVYTHLIRGGFALGRLKDKAVDASLTYADFVTAGR